MSSSSTHRSSRAVARSAGSRWIAASSRNDSASGRSHHSWLRWPNTTPIRRASSRRCRTGSSPQTRTRPEVGTRIPVSILMVVDLPAPFAPM